MNKYITYTIYRKFSNHTFWTYSKIEWTLQILSAKTSQNFQIIFQWRWNTSLEERFYISLSNIFSLYFSFPHIFHRRCSVRKGVLRNFAKFTGKHLCQSLFLNKVAGRSGWLLLYNFGTGVKTLVQTTIIYFVDKTY